MTSWRLFGYSRPARKARGAIDSARCTTKCAAHRNSMHRSSSARPHRRSSSLAKHELKGGRRIASALFPRDERVADVTEAVWGQLSRPRLPAQADAARKIAIPHPTSEAGKPRYQGVVWELDGRPLRLPVVEGREKACGVASDVREILERASGAAYVVRGPAAFERCHIARQVLGCRAYEVHRTWSGGTQ